MPCYKPLSAWYGKSNPKTGKASIVFKRQEAHVPIGFQVPCGQCIGCRLERSRQWAVRCVHEASLYDQNCFITLTFDDAHVNSKNTLVKADFQKFIKRLRKYISSVNVGQGSEAARVRYFHCGEYGDMLDRPHHHACLFNYDFPDKVLWSERRGVKLYRSELLERLWPFGFCTIGDVTFESAAYVARYVMKKVTGKEAAGYYGDRVPEYVTMSRRPGIGTDWFKKFSGDVYPSDFIVIRGGIKCKPPRFYDKIFDLTDSNDMSKIIGMRVSKAKSSDDNSAQRLMQKGMVKNAQLKLLQRGL